MHFSTWLYLVNDVTGIPMPGQGPLSHNQGNRSLTSSTQWQGALPGCPLWQGKPHVEGMWFREGVACSSPLSCPSSQHAWIKVWYGFWVGTSCCVFFFARDSSLKSIPDLKGLVCISEGTRHTFFHLSKLSQESLTDSWMRRAGSHWLLGCWWVSAP